MFLHQGGAGEFSLIFSLIGYSAGGNVLNKLLHSICAFLPHLSGHMAVYVQRKRRRCVAEILLNGFDIVASLDGRDGIGMP